MQQLRRLIDVIKNAFGVNKQHAHGKSLGKGPYFLKGKEGQRGYGELFFSDGFRHGNAACYRALWSGHL